MLLSGSVVLNLVFILLNETLEEEAEGEKRSGLERWCVTFSNLVWVLLCYLISSP